MKLNVDMEKIRQTCEEVSRNNGGLETSSGVTPYDLDRVLHVLVIPQDLYEVLSEIINIHIEEHEKYNQEV